MGLISGFIIVKYQLTDTLNSCMVWISLHSTEEINDFNSTLLGVENVSQKMSQNFSYI